MILCPGERTVDPESPVNRYAKSAMFAGKNARERYSTQQTGFT